MEIALYENAMQAVPLILIALFLDSRSGQPSSRKPRRWDRWQDKVYTGLGVAAFMTSMLVVAGILDASRITDAIVISALTGCISLLFAQIWQRFERQQPSEQAPQQSSD